MANVIVLFIQPILDLRNPNAMVCFYESLAKELADNGNNVLCLNLLNYKKYNSANFDQTTKNTQDIVTKIQNFRPDMIIAFNNQIVEEIIQCTNCPILLAEADDANRFSGQQLITKYFDRYYMVTFSPGFGDENYTTLGFSKKKIISLHMATSIRHENITKDKNISFIGTCFYHEYDKSMIDKITHNTYFYRDLLEYYQDPYNNYDEFIKKYINFFNNDMLLLQQFMDSRTNTLMAVADLGLDLYGLNFDALSPELFILRAAFNKEPKYSLQHNQDIYNSSRVNLSISHVQCKGYGFPWRIYDIMASGGMLVSSYSELLANQTAGIVDVPMYKSPNDARDLCKYALENPSYCADIVAKSNEFIEKFGRWKSNFEILQEKTKVKLINLDNKTSNIIICDAQPLKKFANIKKFFHSRNIRILLKKIKQWWD